MIGLQYSFLQEGVCMTEVSNGQIQTTTLDHLGLVAAICQDLKIAERIDDRLPCDPQRKVSPGRAAVAMILNGLGFTNRRLYLTHQFFESKAVERLLGPDLEAKDITDYTLAHALDDIAEYGSSKLFAEVAFGVAIDNNLLEDKNHLDTTSILVHGAYEVNDDPKTIEVVRGFSKDHRPDLKQIVLSLVVNGPSSIPLWMDPLSSDKVSFHETIKKVEDFRAQIDVKGKFKWVVDAALYTKERLLKNNDYVWVTRVPENITEAKNLVKKLDKEIPWVEGEKGYVDGNQFVIGEVRENKKNRKLRRLSYPCRKSQNSELEIIEFQGSKMLTGSKFISQWDLSVKTDEPCAINQDGPSHWIHKVYTIGHHALIADKYSLYIAHNELSKLKFVRNGKMTEDYMDESHAINSIDLDGKYLIIENQIVREPRQRKIIIYDLDRQEKPPV
jgi:hypothetical protein